MPLLYVATAAALPGDLTAAIETHVRSVTAPFKIFARDRLRHRTGQNHQRVAIPICALDGACEECLIAPEVISDLTRTQVPSDLSHCAIAFKLDGPEGWRNAA